jgi:hypothetical protein
MLAWVLLVANMPTIVCTICSAFLAYKERPQWVWFAGLAVLAGIGGLLTLSVVHAQQHGDHERERPDAVWPAALDAYSPSGQTLTSTKDGSSVCKSARAAVIAAALAWSTALRS